MAGSGNKTEMKISIAQIVGTFGTKGEVKVKILTDFPERFFELKKVFLYSPVSKQTHEIEIGGVRFHKHWALIKIKGIEKKEDAEKLRFFYIQIPKKSLKKLPEGSFYLFEIIGLKVYEKDGKYLGEVSEILRNPANDIYVVKDEEKEILLPALKKFIKKIDIEKGEMWVNTPYED